MNPSQSGPRSACRRLDELPFDNRYARLPPHFHTRLAPEPLPAPYLVATSASAAALLGLEPATLASEAFVESFAGNRLLPGSEPLAAVYSGHQFGVWAGQLGDGRAHLLGGVHTADGGYLEIQLKGAGKTPYSRFADGRAVLRSSIREFLCSEAMAALGVPTTRALCVIGSDAPVVRETVETAAVVTRLAPSFLRFGSFQHWAARARPDALRELVAFVIDHDRPELRDTPRPVEALLADVVRRTAALIAHWQAVGFMHGVMNTDNMSILGLTLDYGPFGFMEAYDPGHVCNHSDHEGRYAFDAQPQIGHWNLLALAGALLPLIGAPDVAQGIVDELYPAVFTDTYLRLMRAKLGLACPEDEDEAFIDATLGLLARQRVDYPRFFRALCHVRGTGGTVAAAQEDAPLRDLFFDRGEADAWLARWRARLRREGSDDAERQARQREVNPKYVLRNWMAEAAIRRTVAGDGTELAAVLDAVTHPYDELPEYTRYSTEPPDWAAGITVSCSS
ncbi:MAG: hypothetical protein IOMNBAOH_02318 [Rhodocyclaceae bacterium]|nr:YdiU family protein [Rhodocyclaceae bacterium]MCG3187664.1 hypothetical protein [Rhodocyclaceae bacterium]